MTEPPAVSATVAADLGTVVSVSVNFRDLEDRVSARWAAHFSERLAKSRH